MNERSIEILEAECLVELVFLHELEHSLEVLLVQIKIVVHRADVFEHFNVTVVENALI